MSKPQVTMYDWEEWLQMWNHELLARYDPMKYNAFAEQSELDNLLASPPPQV